MPSLHLPQLAIMFTASLLASFAENKRTLLRCRAFTGCMRAGIIAERFVHGSLAICHDGVVVGVARSRGNSGNSYKIHADCMPGNIVSLYQYNFSESTVPTRMCATAQRTCSREDSDTRSGSIDCTEIIAGIVAVVFVDANLLLNLGHIHIHTHTLTHTHTIVSEVYSISWAYRVSQFSQIH